MNNNASVIELAPKDRIRVYPIAQSEEMVISRITQFSAKAGFPSPAMDYAVDAIDLNTMLVEHPTSTFLVDVEGTSMIEAFIADPAKLLVDRSLQPKNGDIILASINGEFTVKYLQRKGDQITLVPGNPLYKKQEIVDGMEFLIFGVVSWIFINPRKVNNVRAGRLQ